METFKYDIYTLIEVVENNPCLWDKSNEHYKDKIMRKNAWRLVCSILEPAFEHFEIKRQEETITIVMNKWSHNRDSFTRNMKSKSGQEAKRKYIYAEHMQFLLKNMTADDTESSIKSGLRDEDSDEEETNISVLPQKNSKRKKINNIDKEILNAIRSSTPLIKEDTINDEDKSFLMSLLPSLKKKSDDDKIDFRIEIMQLVNKYFKRNKRCRSFSYDASTMTQESPSPLSSSSSHFDSQYLSSPSPHQSSNEFHTSCQLSSPHQSPVSSKLPSQSSIRILSSKTVCAPNLSQIPSSQPSVSPANNKPPVWIKILKRSPIENNTKEADTAADLIKNYKFK